MSQHTPGPWRVVEEYDGARTVAIMRDFRAGRAIGLHVTADHDWVGPAEVGRIFANAHLVGAAPELLAALRGLARGAQAYPCFCKVATGRATAHTHRCVAAVAAIAKAEGR